MSIGKQLRWDCLHSPLRNCPSALLQNGWFMNRTQSELELHNSQCGCGSADEGNTMQAKETHLHSSRSPIEFITAQAVPPPAIVLLQGGQECVSEAIH